MGEWGRALRSFSGLLPGGLVLLAAAFLHWNDTSRTALAPSAPFFCFGALAAALFLSWYFDQSRPLYATAAIGLGVIALDQYPAGWNAGRLTVAVLVPLNFTLFALLRERGVASFDSLVQAGILVAQIIAMPWLAATAGPPAAVSPVWIDAPEAALGVPRFVALAFAGAAATLLVLVARRHSKVEMGVFWALVAMLAGLLAGTETTFWFWAGTAGLALAFGVLEYGRDLAHRDDLTGLPGRRALNSVLERTGRPYAIAICDVDHFKRFNDTYGHDAGDQALRMVAARLQHVGGGGRAFRYGGEEFVLLFRGRSAAEAARFADEVRQAVADAGFTPRHPGRPAQRPVDVPLPSHPIAPRLTITISVGLADTSTFATPDLVLDAADLAMYQAKQAGRNCLRIAGATER